VEIPKTSKTVISVYLAINSYAGISADFCLCDRTTLWVRVLGWGEPQERAIREILALPDSEPKRYQVLRLIASWRVRIDIGELEGFVEREEIMALSEAFLVWEEKLKETCWEQGDQRKASTIALNLLQGNLPLEQIARFTGLTIAQIQQL
jgi:hypothetical protein